MAELHPDSAFSVGRTRLEQHIRRVAARVGRTLLFQPKRVHGRFRMWPTRALLIREQQAQIASLILSPAFLSAFAYILLGRLMLLLV